MNYLIDVSTELGRSFINQWFNNNTMTIDCIVSLAISGNEAQARIRADNQLEYLNRVAFLCSKYRVLGFNQSFDGAQFANEIGVFIGGKRDQIEKDIDAFNAWQKGRFGENAEQCILVINKGGLSYDDYDLESNASFSVVASLSYPDKIEYDVIASWNLPYC